MSLMITALRRSLWLVLIGAVGGVAWSWWSDRNAPPSPTAPPEWPPLGPTPTAPADIGTPTADGLPSGTPAQPAPTTASTSNTASSADPAGTKGTTEASIVNALVDAPEARSSAATGHWVAPNDDGACPADHPIKANDNSGIFHVPGGRFYDRTKAERCYTTAEAATADGYRQAKA